MVLIAKISPFQPQLYAVAEREEYSKFKSCHITFYKKKCCVGICSVETLIILHALPFNHKSVLRKGTKKPVITEVN